MGATDRIVTTTPTGSGSRTATAIRTATTTHTTTTTVSTDRLGITYAPSSRPAQEDSAMPAPTIDPHRRDPAEVAPTDTYRPADPVWVFRGGAWHAGVVEAASALAAMVTYRPNDARGTGVDTMTAPYVLPRAETDPLLDPKREG